MNKIETDILIIGGGAAGISAALSVAENSTFRVLVVDDNPALGGQIWRGEMGKMKSPEAKKLIEKVEHNKIVLLNNTQVFAQVDYKTLLAETLNGSVELKFEKMILANGARERFLPFPNWTLPNIYGAGGLQALVKSGLSVKDKKIVVAGTGPLLLVVAEFLASKGAKIVSILEQTNRTKLLKFGIGLWKYPKKLFQTLSLQNNLYRMGYFPNSYVSSAEGSEKLEALNFVKDEKQHRIECDMLAYGFHLVPNLELALMVGCKTENGYVSVDEFQKTSVKNIFCAGEPTGIGGVEASLIEGNIAGLSAIDENDKAKELFAKRKKMRKFADKLNETFTLRKELKTLANDKTIVCRCEDVTFGKLKEFNSFREAKLQARCGMGACQGKICGSATEFLFDWKNESVRPPICPVKLENLVD